MSLINHAIPNLFNGVSQQSASIRQASQAELQENAFSSIVDGVHKRHPTQHIAKLFDGNIGAAYVHVINRDPTERYVVVIKDGVIRVWDVYGVEKTVSAPNGYGYLSLSDPSSQIAAVTIADYTIIVNKTKTTATSTSGSAVGLTSTVQSFSKLPATGTTGGIYKITGDASNSFGTYYVKWNGSTYEESTYNGTVEGPDPATMPYQLVRNADGSFTFSQITWKGRMVGDTNSAANPSFIGKKINDVVFFRNRLGFLSSENIVFSRASDFFAFYPETATQVLDSDPVDTAVSSTKVSILRAAIPFNKNLLMFSDQTQFILASNDTLTPKSVVIHPTTEFEYSAKAKPVASGNNVYFPVDKSGYTGIREYYVVNLQLTFDADDVTAHVPRYIPGNVHKLSASTNEDILFAITRDEPNALYVYKFYWSGEEKAQSSWSKWKLSSDAQILSMDMMNTKLYLVVQRSDGVYLECIDIQVGLKESDLPILVHLDRKTLVTGTYNATTNKTTWTLPYPDAANAQIVLGGFFTGKAGARVNTTVASANTLTADGDFSGHTAYVGTPYTMRYRFSPQFAKDSNKVSMAQAILKLRMMRLFYTKSGYFRVEVTPKNRDTYTYLFTGKILGVSSLILGVPQIESGVFKFPVMSDGRDTIIDLVNDSHLPSFFQSAEWEAMMTIRSQRM